MPIGKRPLCDLADIQPGRRTRKHTARSKGEPVPVIGDESLTAAGIDRDRFALVEPFGDPPEKYRTRAGDVLIPARSLDLQRACVVTPESAGEPFNASVLAIRCEGELEPRLLHAWFSWPDARPHWLTRESLGELPVAVPPVERQGKIVALLEAADGAGEERRDIAMKLAVGKMVDWAS